MRMLRNWILVGVLLCMSSIHAGAEGLPLPWPFPWARDCAVNWTQMEGTYLLSDSANLDHIDLKITVITKQGFKLVRVSRYSQDGSLLYDGFTFVNEKQKTLRLYLVPANSNETPVWAVIKLHYQSWDLQCTADHLVPILTLEKTGSTSHEQTQYKLVKVVNDNN
jgi:hypothetical protein